MNTAPAGERLRVAVAGCNGRMGRMLVEAVLDAPDLALAAALVRPGHAWVGQDAGLFLGRASGVAMRSDVAPALADSAAQVLIDFTQPEATLAHLAACRAHGVAGVIGTTGWRADQPAQLQALARDVPMVVAANMSIGVHAVLQLLRQAAQTLGDNYDVEVLEMHHRSKVDAPSGTALAMGDAVATARGQRLADCAVYAREGLTGPRPASSIGFATLRGGDVIGDHTVVFAGPGERIEISHKSTHRGIYAQGSLRAARFVARQSAGIYSMRDVLEWQA